MGLFGKKKAEEEEAQKEEEAVSSKAMARAKGIFEDLLNLEVNIISTPGMTARKMPDPSGAFGEVARMYDDLLFDFGTLVRRTFERRGRPSVSVFEPKEAMARNRDTSWSMVDDEGRLVPITPAKLVRSAVAVNLGEFKTLRERAIEAIAVGCALVAEPRWPEREKVEADLVLLKRVYRNSEQLIDVLTELPKESDRAAVMKQVPESVTLTSQQLLTLRKVWEVGTATVLMQTVVQLDGDIVTRLHEGHPSASSKDILALHRESTDNAIKNWQFLGTTLAQFMTSALRKLL